MAARYSETKLTDQYSLLYSGQLLEGELLDMKKRIEEELASIRPISYGFSREEDYYGAEGSGPAYTMADVIKMNPLQKAAKEIKRQLLSHKTRKQPSSSGVQRHASTSRVNWDQSPKLSYFTRSSSNSATERDTSTSSESDESWIEDDSPTLSPSETFTQNIMCFSSERSTKSVDSTCRDGTDMPILSCAAIHTKRLQPPERCIFR